MCLPSPPPPHPSPTRSAAQRPRAMMAFSDGIKMSRPTAVTHANCIVYTVCLRQTGSNLFLFDAFSFFLFFFSPSSAFRRSLIVMSLSGGPAAPLVNVSDVSSFHPSLSFLFFFLSRGCRFTDTPTWPPTASTTFTRGKCVSSSACELQHRVNLLYS